MNNNNKLGVALNPGGIFAENIRIDLEGDDTELRESMRAHGWVTQFPALIDEHGVVLVGHRRLKIAKELGIEPVIQKLIIGTGEAADAERLRIAIVSNVGHKPMTKPERQRIALYLYGERDWTMGRIAKALNVDKATVSRDLDNCCDVQQSKPAKTATNPKGAGRPKGSKRKAPKPHPHADKIIDLADQGLTNSEIASQTGVSQRQVRHTVEEELIRREAKAELPKIDLSTLSISVQQKCETWKRQTEKRLRIEIAEEERAKVRQWWNEDLLPSYQKYLDDAKAIIKAQKGVFTSAQYRQLLAALHPDRSMSAEALHDLFILFKSKEVVLLLEKDSQRSSDWSLPKTYEEWMERKRKVAEARKVKRSI